MKKGFTLLEVIFVIAIAAIIFAVASPYAMDFYRRQLVEEARSNVTSALEQARHNAVLQKNDSNFGVHFIAGSYIIFQGDSYETRDPDFDQVFPMIDDIDLSGNPDIIYSKLTGEVSATGTIPFTFGSITRSIEIADNGTVSKVD